MQERTRVKIALRKLRDSLPKSTFLYVLSGLMTYVPGLLRFLSEPCFAEAPRYNYSVWLRHLVTAHRYGLNTVPKAIAELGPGNSLGVGLSGMLSGANRLFALDVVNYTSVERNLAVFEQLAEMFRRREGIPDEREFPSLWPTLNSYEFPSEILTEERMDTALRPERLNAIRAAICQRDTAGHIVIQYQSPWWASEVIQHDAVDMVLSQYVLEHVDQLDKTYAAISQWLRPGGISSQVVDFSCHNLVEPWNGHWRYGPTTWQLIRGKKPYLLNRVPCSRHLELLNINGLSIVDVLRGKAKSNMQRQSLAPVFRKLSEDDITTRCAYILAKKPFLV